MLSFKSLQTFFCIKQRPGSFSDLNQSLNTTTNTYWQIFYCKIRYISGKKKQLQCFPYNRTGLVGHQAQQEAKNYILHSFIWKSIIISVWELLCDTVPKRESTFVSLPRKLLMWCECRCHQSPFKLLQSTGCRLANVNMSLPKKRKSSNAGDKQIY